MEVKRVSFSIRCRSKNNVALDFIGNVAAQKNVIHFSSRSRFLSLELSLSSFFLFLSLEMKASRNLHWRVALKEGSRVVMIFISIKGERGRSIAQRL